MKPASYLFATSRYYLLLMTFRGTGFDVDITQQEARP